VDNPRLSAKGLLSQVKESTRACNKIKISFRLTQSLLLNEVADTDSRFEQKVRSNLLALIVTQR